MPNRLLTHTLTDPFLPQEFYRNRTDEQFCVLDIPIVDDVSEVSVDAGKTCSDYTTVRRQ